MKALVDAHGRQVRKLRVSLTDACNLRCHYCMPVDAKFMNESRFLSPAQYHEIVEELCELGLEEMRLTGGEPLMRRSFGEIADRLGALSLKKIGLTTNGILLDRHFDVLMRNHIRHLNVSLDSLNEDTFANVTKGRHLSRVLQNVETAVRLGLEVKINVVAMKGVNDAELFDFVAYSAKVGVEVRFLELMKIGYARETQERQFISAREMMDRLRSQHQLTPLARPHDSTSFNFSLENGARIGFIASESQPFCGQCSRWRLSADGTMRACLLKDDGISMTGLTRDERARAYLQLLGMKPELRPREVGHRMNAIGG